MGKTKNKEPKPLDLSPETLAALRKGLQDSAEGKTVYLGSFAAYAEEEEEEERPERAEF